MLRRTFIATGIALAALSAGAFWPHPDPSFPDPDSMAGPPATAEAILFLKQRVAANPNPIAYTLLGQLHARRSRETGDLAELGKAEAALTAALKHAPTSAQAAQSLASVYFAQHRFSEALDTATKAHGLDPRLGSSALVGDVLVATGDYQGAAAAYTAAAAMISSPGLIARMAHLEELRGDLETALASMERAAAAHLRAGGAGEEAAWYQARLGDLNFTIGELGEAERRYQASLEVFPGYYAGMAGLAKVAAARDDLDAAIDLYERAIAVVPRPELLAAVGDLYLLTGESNLAADRYATVEAIAQLAGGVYDRTLATFYADHGRARDALRLAELGLETRHDIYAHDTRAWALYRLGRLTEAREAIDAALILGTRDPILQFHAGSISLALGERDRAISELTAALDLNPDFHPIFAPTALAMLEEVGG